MITYTNFLVSLPHRHGTTAFSEINPFNKVWVCEEGKRINSFVFPCISFLSSSLWLSASLGKVSQAKGKWQQSPQRKPEAKGALPDHLSELAGGIDRHANITHASGLLYWDSRSWPYFSSLKSKVSLARVSSQFGYTDVLHSRAWRSRREVLVND